MIQSDFDYEKARSLFERLAGKMPSHCQWTGRSYCATTYNAWDANTYGNEFRGFLMLYKHWYDSMHPSDIL